METHWQMAAKTRMGKYLTGIEKSFVQINPNQIILDVGCETGKFSHKAAISIDLDILALKRLKKENALTNPILADARYLPFKPESVNQIICVETLDYIPQLNQVFEQFQIVLSDNGTCFISFSNSSSWKAKFHKGSFYTHSYKGVISEATFSSFVIIKSLGYNWLPFSRCSENSLIPFLGFLENLLGLRKICARSPWVLVQITKYITQS